MKPTQTSFPKRFPEVFQVEIASLVISQWQCPRLSFYTIDTSLPWASSDISDFWKNHYLPCVCGLVNFSAPKGFLPLRVFIVFVPLMENFVFMYHYGLFSSTFLSLKWLSNGNRRLYSVIWFSIALFFPYLATQNSQGWMNKTLKFLLYKKIQPNQAI